MSDLISRSALMEIFEERIIHDNMMCPVIKVFDVLETIEDAPTVEAKPVVHGEWKRVGSGSLYDTYECTNCHRPPKWDCLGDNHWRIAFTDICPYCGAIMNGADMRGEKHD